jgi:outer membrane protein TolC
MTRFRNLTGITGPVELSPVDLSVYEDVLVRLSSISDEEAQALYEEFRRRFASSNTTLARAALNNRRAQYNHSLTRRDWVPTISATIFSTGLGYSVSGGFDATSSGGITLRGTIPVDFWVLANRLEKSRIARDSAAIDYNNTQISVDTELQSAILNTLSQAGSVLSTRRSLEYTQRHFEYVSERYRLSQSSVSEVSDASSLYINSRNSHIRATYSFLQALSRLRSMGAIEDEQALLALLLN